MRKSPKELAEAKDAFKIKLEGLDDEGLYKTAKEFIWLSAYANNNPRSDYHWQCDMTYDEAKRRGKLEIYSNAHRDVSQG